MSLFQRFLNNVFYLIKQFYELKFSEPLKLEVIQYDKLKKSYLCIYHVKVKRTKQVMPLVDLYDDFEVLKLFSKSDIQYIAYYAGKFTERLKNEQQRK